jgi:hypothetical protein
VNVAISIAALNGWLYGGIVDPQARAEFPALLLSFGEGSTLYPYPDDEGNITIGRGNLLPSLAAFSAIEWVNPDSTPASANAVQTAWLTMQGHASIVKANGPDRWPGGAAFAKYTAIRATQQSVDALIEARLDQFDTAARRDWPGWDSSPPAAQKALMRLYWACGEGGMAPGKWPHLHTAWIAQDWATCARECVIPALDATEPNANTLESALFLSCVRDAETKPDVTVGS